MLEDSFVSKYVLHLIALTHSDNRPCAEVRTIVATFSLNYLSLDRGYSDDCFDFHLGPKGKSFMRFYIVL